MIGTPCSPPRRLRSGGFTLLEALVAMVLLVLMLAVLTGSIRFASQTRDVTANRIDAMDTMRITQDFLRQTLSQTHPKQWVKAVGRPYAFRGDRDEVELAAPLTARVGVGGLFMLKLSLVEGDNRASRAKKLIVSRMFPEPDAQEMPDFSNAETTVLAENIAELELAYLGRDDPNTDPYWRDDWRDGAKMPEAIRVRVKPVAGTTWPEMVIPLRVAPRNRGGRFGNR